MHNAYSIIATSIQLNLKLSATTYVFSKSIAQTKGVYQTTQLLFQKEQYNENQVIIIDRLKSARRTTYAIINSGLQNTLGILPSQCTEHTYYQDYYMILKLRFISKYLRYFILVQCLQNTSSC